MVAIWVTMARARKTWTEKLADSKGLPKIIEIDPVKSKRWGEGTMVIPSPLEVDAVIRKVPKGRLITINGMRQILAAKHGAGQACAITTGIFSWIAAHASMEQEKSGQKRVTPWWRVLKEGGTLNEKCPGGVELQRQRLEGEGHRVLAKGRRWIVADHEARLVAGQGV